VTELTASATTGGEEAAGAAPSATLKRGFHALSFEEACALAEREGKAVMVEFYATWCTPCKVLDQVTFADEDVIKWMREKVVAIKVDGERQVELAKRYGINSYPSILFLEPDGSVKALVRGFREPKDFLARANDALAGIAPADRLQEQLAASGGTDVGLRHQLAEELLESGKNEAALEHLMWLFDHAAEHVPEYRGMRLGPLLGRIVMLGQSYPPAMEALRVRRERAAAKLLEGEGGLDEAFEVGALDQVLQTPEQTVALYDELRQRVDLDEQVRRALVSMVMERLVEAKRYAEVAADMGDAELVMADMFDQWAAASGALRGDPMRLMHMKFTMLEAAGQFYEALVGAGKRPEADKVVERLLDFDGEPSTYARLIHHAQRAGDDEAAEALRRRGQATLPADQHGLLERPWRPWP
jgi:thiol-disulfide isomerase/thioredoxin